ncbi:hypothetical protein RN001_001127 [Aquatica leii]|uniref:Protein LTV1 homolog n=1 Tax=Aquatica leii TaxID=1421715 RepID=A0AAN7PN55_9COLE|nr:hypothetical protein RN001_001127 [Aquatica leii]
MPKNKRKFIDRKNAVTFHLVHRSQQDPLVADESAPQHVLVPLQEKPNKEKRSRLKEQEKYGILYDDDYNYLQHLRDVQKTTEWVPVETKPRVQPKLQLPSSVFASAVEEEVGLLNKAAPHSGPRLDLDPDVVAAMDEDFDFDNPDNELEDNFVELANVENNEDEYSDVSSDYGSSEALDEVCSLDGPQYTFNDEEIKSRFTEYSMSSSVIRRNEQLTLLDDKFEQIYSAYDETEIGPLDLEDIEGHLPETSELLLKYAEDFEKNKQREQLNKEEIISRLNLENDSDSDKELVLMEVPEKEKWDCESILSTYSNIYNHPKLITEPKVSKIKVSGKTGIPTNVLGSNKLTARALSKFNEENRTNITNGSKSVGGKSIISTLSILSIRPPDETLEEKKERKRMLKEYRKDRRYEKKLNTQAFKEEQKKQVKIAINNRHNLLGNNIL